MMENQNFDWLEYSVFGLTIALSLLIGIYFGFIKKVETSLNEYLLGGKNMGLLPISISLITTTVAGDVIIGGPSEIYYHGTQFLVNVVGRFVGGLASACLILPIFYRLQLTSLYEYFELRYNSSVRKLVSLLYTIFQVFATTLAVYVPALALNQVVGVNIQLAATCLGLICMFYTAFGGLKAVVWTDTLQGVIMAASVVIVAIYGAIHVGGLSKIWEAANNGERIEFFRMNPDPTIRLTFWNTFIGGAVIFVAVVGISPADVQRYGALPTMRKAQWSVCWLCIGLAFFTLVCAFIALVIYTKYEKCDPFSSGLIEKPDQVVPYFIADISRNLRGLAGTFMAGLISAGLSTMSTNLNTVSGNIYTDFIEPYFGKKSDLWAGNCLKMLVFLYGGICLLFLTVIGKLGQILEMTITLNSIANSTVLGIFILGMFFPTTNSLGAIVGALTGFILLTINLIGFRIAAQSGAIPSDIKPLSTEGCLFNVSYPISAPLPDNTGYVFPLFKVSIMYYALLETLVTVIVGLVISHLTGPNRAEQVDGKLVSPLVQRFYSSYRLVPMNGRQETRKPKSDI